MLNWRARKSLTLDSKRFATFSNLRAVDLRAHGCYFGWACRFLARLSRLESLNLTATVVDDAGVAALRRKQTLKRLIFSRQNVRQSELASRDARP